MSIRTALIISTAFAAACGGSDYDDSWGAGDIVGGKTDGLLDLAEPLQFGETVHGTVDQTGMNLYKIELFHTDRVSVTMKRTGGDLNPHVQLFTSLSQFERSTSFDLSNGQITKIYEISESSTYGVVARAFRNEGSGEYDLTIECLSGPCAGQFSEPDTSLDAQDANTCIQAARLCAFDRLPGYNGAVDPTQAREIWDGCVADQNVDGVSCTSACEGTTLCDEYVAELPFYAGQSAACTATLSDCMEVCTDSNIDPQAWITPDTVDNASEAVCFNGPLGGQCNFYARDHETCGGDVLADSGLECRTFCWTTIGAWIDDLDTICEDECGFCDEVEEDCEYSCGTNDPSDDCFYSCVVNEGCN